MNLTQGNLNELSDAECSICLEELDNGEKNRVLQCGHIFHTGCIEPWLKKYFTCPYCRQCEAEMECYWLSLKSYGLSWINKLRKYKYTLKHDHIEITRKKYIHKINLYFIQRVYSKNNTIVFSFLDGKTITLWFRNAYAPFMTLKQRLSDFYKNQRIEIEQQQIQYQIQQIEQMELFRPIQTWHELSQIEYANANANHFENQNDEQA